MRLRPVAISIADSSFHATDEPLNAIGAIAIKSRGREPIMTHSRGISLIIITLDIGTVVHFLSMNVS